MRQRASVARMSEAISGTEEHCKPGYRFAHPGYSLPFEQPEMGLYAQKSQTEDVRKIDRWPASYKLATVSRPA
jgi:hypothetical protein